MLASGFLLTLGKFIGNIAQENSNQNKSCRYLCKSNRIPEFHSLSFLSNHTVISKNSIPSKMLKINVLQLNKSPGNAMLLPTNGIANHAAEILIDSPDNALSHGRY